MATYAAMGRGRSRSHPMLPPRIPCGRSRQSPAVLTRSRPPNAETQLVSATLPQPRFIRGAPHLSDPACISILVVSLLLAPAFDSRGPSTDAIRDAVLDPEGGFASAGASIKSMSPPRLHLRALHR